MRYLLTLLLIAAVAMLWSCDRCKPCKEIVFSGKVVSNIGKELAGATVSVNDSETKTDEQGEFRIAICGRTAASDFLVTVRKFGYGLFSRRYANGFEEKVIELAAGTVVTFDPSVETTISDTVSGQNPYKPGLLDLDTAVLFKTIPKVYDPAGKLIDLGYPAGAEGIFDFLRFPLGGNPGLTITIPPNAFVDGSNNPPPPGARLQASLSTIDFFNPDGMPGDFVVETREGRGYMESFSAGSVEISDGEKKYQIKKGASVKVTFPVYPVRLHLKEILPEEMPLLHYDEVAGVWKETGKGRLNETGDAYVAEVNHFSVLNMDMIKTGPSKCFKIRQMLKFGAADNTTNYLSSYRAQLVVPPTTTTNFNERDYLVDETTGCVPVAVGGSFTNLHPITRIPDTYIAVVFSKDGVADTLEIAIAMPAVTSIPAETAVATAMDCSTATCSPAADCTSPDPLDASASGSACNTTCWMPDCGFIPFSNNGETTRIVGVAMGGGNVKVKWVNTRITGSMRVTAYATGDCTGGGSVIFSKCASGGCGPAECLYGEVVHSATAGSTVSFKIEVFDGATTDCSGIPVDVCSGAIVVI